MAGAEESEPEDGVEVLGISMGMVMAIGRTRSGMTASDDAKLAALASVDSCCVVSAVTVVQGSPVVVVSEIRKTRVLLVQRSGCLTANTGAGSSTTGSALLVGAAACVGPRC